MKRTEVPESTNGQLIKKRKGSTELPRGELAQYQVNTGALIHGYARTSDLRAPIMELAGHAQEVLCTRFDTTGRLIASGSSDRKLLLCNTFGD